MTWKRHTPVFILVIAMAAGCFLRFSAANHAYISQWDEAYHALVAKNLTKHPLVPTLYEKPLLEYDYREWGSNHIWLHKPPLPLWLMALSMSIAGDDEINLRLPSIALGTLSILLLFCLGARLWGNAGRWAGALAGLLLALNPLMIRLVSGTIPTDHIDAINTFFVLLALFAFAVAAARGHWSSYLLAGVALGLAFLCKSMASLVVAPACLLLAWRNEGRARDLVGRFAVALTGFLIIALPWQIYSAIRWPREYGWESQYTWRHLYTAIEGHAHPASWYLEILPVHFGGPARVTYALLLLPVFAAAAVACRSRDRRLGAIALWALLPYLVFSLVGTKLYAYVAPAVPALVLLVGWLFVWLCGRSRRRGEQTATGGRTTFLGPLVGLCILTGLGLIHLTSVAAERFTADYSAQPWNVLYDTVSFRRAMKSLAEAPGKKVIFNVGDYQAIQAMYYADCPAYAAVPDPAVLRGLIQQGYQAYIVLDELQTNRDAIIALHQAGLLERTIAVHIGGPRVQRRKHPYLN